MSNFAKWEQIKNLRLSALTGQANARLKKQLLSDLLSADDETRIVAIEILMHLEEEGPVNAIIALPEIQNALKDGYQKNINFSLKVKITPRYSELIEKQNETIINFLNRTGFKKTLPVQKFMYRRGKNLPLENPPIDRATACKISTLQSITPPPNASLRIDGAHPS